jgi:hypothetical protein
MQQITSKSPRIDAIMVANKINIVPLEHQCAIVHNMMEFENNEIVKTVESITYKSNIGILTDLPGSGKTLSQLMLIAMMPLAKIRPATCVKNNTGFLSPKNNLGTQYTFDLVRPSAIYRENYSDIDSKNESKLWSVNIIIVAETVFDQWADILRDNTSFRYLAISGKAKLIELKNLYVANTLPFDVILIKSFDINKTDAYKIIGHVTSARNSLSALGEIFRRDCVSRVMIDDFDFINAPKLALLPPAMFTWIISATNNVQHHRIDTTYKDVVSMWPENHRVTTYQSIMSTMTRAPTYEQISQQSSFIKQAFGISCNDKFIHDSMDVAGVHYYEAKFIHPRRRFVGAISSISGDLAELLNGDAVESAAIKVGIAATSIPDIFEKLLADNMKIYKRCTKIERYLTDVVGPYYELLPQWANIEHNYPKQILVNKFADNLRLAGPQSWLTKKITQKHDLFNTQYTIVESETAATKSNCSTAFQRVQDNLREGECPFTCIALADTEGIFIAKCCGLVICQEALPIVLKATSGYAGMTRTCPKCRAVIQASTFIYIAGKSVSFDKLLDNSAIAHSLIDEDMHEKIITNAPDVESSAVIGQSLAEQIAKLGQKFTCMIDILHGNKIENLKCKTGTMKINGIMDGFYHTNSVSTSKTIKGRVNTNANHKTIIFAYYDETVRKICDALHLTGFKYEILNKTTASSQQHRFTESKSQIKTGIIHVGKKNKKSTQKGKKPAESCGISMNNKLCMPHKQTSEQKNDRNDQIDILIIRGSEECAGLNLQAATRIIFMHLPANTEVEKQLAGRAMRHGRTTDLEIYYVIYDHEDINRHYNHTRTFNPDN